MNPLRRDYTTGQTRCRSGLHVIPEGQKPTRDGRQCRECRRVSLARAQRRYRRTARGNLTDIRNGSKRRGGASRTREDRLASMLTGHLAPGS